MCDVEKFLRVTAGDGVVFKSISTTGVAKIINKVEALSNKIDNIYFLGGIKAGATRWTDSDVGDIHYIRLDIDIKKQVKTFLGTDVGKEEILELIDMVKEGLEQDKFLKEWSYIVYSGGGCHIYYSNISNVTIGDVLTTKIWQLAMKRIYTLYNTTIGEEYLYADMAVCNAARIMRLPTSINQKYNEECTIVYSEPMRQASLFKYIYNLGHAEHKRLLEVSAIRRKEIEALRLSLRNTEGGEATDVKYEIINKFPAYIISQMLLPQFVFDGKKNFKVEGKLKGFYYVEETNTICNGGSEEYAWASTESCWSNFSLVERQLGLKKADVFTWFEEHFKI